MQFYGRWDLNEKPRFKSWYVSGGLGLFYSFIDGQGYLVSNEDILNYDIRRHIFDIRFLPQIGYGFRLGNTITLDLGIVFRVPLFCLDNNDLTVKQGEIGTIERHWDERIQMLEATATIAIGYRFNGKN